MADLDLEPHEYRPSGLRREPKPKWFRNWLLVGLVMIGWGWWNRGALSVDMLFLYVAIFSGLSGMALYGWLRYIP